MGVAGQDRLFCLFWPRALKARWGQDRSDKPPQCPAHTHTLRTDILLLDLGQRWTSRARMSSSTSCSGRWRTSRTTATSSSTTSCSGLSCPQTATLTARCKPHSTQSRRIFSHSSEVTFFQLEVETQYLPLQDKYFRTLKCPRSNISPTCSGGQIFTLKCSTRSNISPT